jgi:hypothetical protein
MKRSKIRAFTERGLAEFREYVLSGKIAADPPPTHLLFGKEYATELEHSGLLVPRIFTTKFDLGMAVATIVQKEELARVFADDAVWPWLSLYFHESTMPKKGGGWFIGAAARHLIEHIPGRTQDQSHRHLVKAATICVERFGTQARVLMDQPSGQSKIEEQVMSRSTGLQLSTSQPFVKALNRLYWDSDRKEVKRGARGDGPGSIMRLIRVLNQLDATYDFPSLTADEIVDLLPQGEFGLAAAKAKPAARPRASKS